MQGIEEREEREGEVVGGWVGVRRRREERVPAGRIREEGVIQEDNTRDWRRERGRGEGKIGGRQEGKKEGGVGNGDGVRKKIKTGEMKK